MPKARVYELAKEFGVSSKQVLAKLKEMGEFVKSASSTVEPPVVRRLHKEFGQTATAKGTAQTAKKQRTVARAARPARTGEHRAPHPSPAPRFQHPPVPTPGALFSSSREGSVGVRRSRSERSSARPGPRGEHRESAVRHEPRRERRGVGLARQHSARPMPRRRRVNGPRPLSLIHI